VIALRGLPAPGSFLSLFMLLAAVAAPLAAQERVALTVWAVQATQEGREAKHFDAGLAEIQKILAPLPYDTFSEVKVHQNKQLPFQAETKLALDDRYTLIVHPTGREEDGRVRMAIRVEMPPRKQGEAPVAAISVTLLLKPGEKIKLQGLRADSGGELVVVLGTAG